MSIAENYGTSTPTFSNFDQKIDFAIGLMDGDNWVTGANLLKYITPTVQVITRTKASAADIAVTQTTTNYSMVKCVSEAGKTGYTDSFQTEKIESGNMSFGSSDYFYCLPSSATSSETITGSESELTYKFFAIKISPCVSSVSLICESTTNIQNWKTTIGFVEGFSNLLNEPSHINFGYNLTNKYQLDLYSTKTRDFF